MWIVLLIGFSIVALSHTAPARLVLDAMAGDRAIWHIPRDDPATVYLTFDDGPNPTTTPDLLDVLAAQNARATFFLIDRHITPDTAPIVRRMFVEGHAVADERVLAVRGDACVRRGDVHRDAGVGHTAVEADRRAETGRQPLALRPPVAVPDHVQLRARRRGGEPRDDRRQVVVLVHGADVDEHRDGDVETERPAGVGR